MFALMVSLKSTISWVTMAMLPRRDFMVTSRMSRPPTTICPEVASKSRGRRLAMVVLPEPDSPTSAMRSPCPAEKLTPVSAYSLPV